MYTGLGLSALIFITHGLLVHGWEIQNRRMSLSCMGLMAGFNLIGAAAYALRVCLQFSILIACVLTIFRFRKGGFHVNMISLAAVIRYFIFWWLSPVWCICLAFLVRLISFMDRLNRARAAHEDSRRSKHLTRYVFLPYMHRDSICDDCEAGYHK